MKNHIIYCIIYFLLSGAAIAQNSFWHDQQGNPIPNTDAQSAISDFGGWLIVTSDTDWRAKWETPSYVVPKFKEAKTVIRGEHIFVLMFFSNPGLDKNGSADVTCDIEVVKPNGGIAIHKNDMLCFRGQLKGNPYNLYLSQPIIEFVGDPGDPEGKWLVKVTLKDNVRRVLLPLKTSFVLR